LARQRLPIVALPAETRKGSDAIFPGEDEPANSRSRKGKSSMTVAEHSIEIQPPTWHRLVLGDWNRIVRDPLDLLRLAYFAGTILWVVNDRAASDGLVGASAVLLVARLVNLPRFFDLSLIAGMTITGWGSALHFYGQWGPYDNIVHALMPALLTPVFYILLVRLGVLPELRDLRQPHHQIGFFLIAFAFGLAVSGGWEVIEWWLDQWFGAHRVKDASDTALDLTSGVLGSIGAGFLLITWSLHAWGCRRVPARVVEQRLIERRFAREVGVK
jgi:hypothetical protein